MQQQDKTAGSAGISPADIIYILFRRKWLILFFTLLGIGGAAAFYFYTPATYSSEAKLFIRYVLEKKMPTAAGGDNSQIIETTSHGSTVLASEVEVMTSYDLALEVAQKVGPQKILPNAPAGEASAEAAASAIRNGITVEIPKQSDVVQLGFRHSDPAVVQPVLAQLIA